MKAKASFIKMYDTEDAILNIRNIQTARKYNNELILVNMVGEESGFSFDYTSMKDRDKAFDSICKILLVEEV